MRSLIRTVPPASPALRNLVPTLSLNCSKCRFSSCSELTSAGNVRSADRDRRSWYSCTGRLSSPFALLARSMPREPNKWANRPSDRAASSPILVIPWPAKRFADFGPTPQSMDTGSGAKNAASDPGGTTISPLGLPTSVAIFATSLLLATPHEVGRSNCARIAACISAAACSPPLGSSLASMNASSIDICSTNGAADLK